MTIPTTAQLEHLLNLTKKKKVLQDSLEKLDWKIASLFGGRRPTSLKATASTRKPRRRKTRLSAESFITSAKPTRGGVTESVLALLKSAGEEGLHVADVARKLGAKKVNIEMWFSRTGKKIAGLKKVAPATYAFLTGTAQPAAAKSSRRGRPAKSAAGAGTLKDRILAALKTAGKAGLSVGEVAEQIGAKKSSINVWFYTTGKKVRALKKVARGRFALRG